MHCLAYFWGFMFVFLVLRDGFLLFYGMDEWKMKPRFGFAEIWVFRFIFSVLFDGFFVFWMMSGLEW